MKRPRIFYFAFVFACFILAVAIFAPILTDFDPQYVDLSQKLQKPDATHIFGTDHLGRDVFARIVYGTRLSISISLFISVLTAAIAFPVGLIVGWVGGKLESIFVWIANIVMAFPAFLLSMAFAGVLGQGLENIIIAVTAVEWVYYARIIRNMVFSLKNTEYVQIAISMGGSTPYILKKHILPFIWKPVLIALLMNIGNIILMISGFSFLGIGVQPNVAEWGMMLNDAKPYFRTIPTLVMYPGMAIFLTVLTFNLLGEYWEKREELYLWRN